MGGLGLSPPDALQSPTVVPVCVLGPDDEIGGIERGSVGGRDRGAGSIAPAIIRAMEDVRFVMQGGRLPKGQCGDLVSLCCARIRPATRAVSSFAAGGFPPPNDGRRVQALHLLMPSKHQPIVRRTNDQA